VTRQPLLRLYSALAELDEGTPAARARARERVATGGALRGAGFARRPSGAPGSVIVRGRSGWDVGTDAGAMGPRATERRGIWPRGLVESEKGS